MKIGVVISKESKTNKELEIGNLVEIRGEEDKGLYMIIEIGDTVYNLLKIGDRSYKDCAPKNQVKPFYGTITITAKE